MPNCSRSFTYSTPMRACARPTPGTARRCTARRGRTAARRSQRWRSRARAGSWTQTRRGKAAPGIHGCLGCRGEAAARQADGARLRYQSLRPGKMLGQGLLGVHHERCAQGPRPADVRSPATSGSAAKLAQSRHRNGRCSTRGSGTRSVPASSERTKSASERPMPPSDRRSPSTPNWPAPQGAPTRLRFVRHGRRGPAAGARGGRCPGRLAQCRRHHCCSSVKAKRIGLFAAARAGARQRGCAGSRSCLRRWGRRGRTYSPPSSSGRASPGRRQQSAARPSRLIAVDAGPGQVPTRRP